MPMTLYCTRAKSFVSEENGTKQFHLLPGPHPQPAPFWVAETATYKHGIKDKSIVNLTPPEQMPGYRPAPAAVVEEPEDASGIEEGTEAAASEEDVEQTEVPQAPFGGQPMTPVSPAPRIGSVRSGSGRGGK